MQNVLILRELKSKFFNDKYVINFSRKMFEEISEIELQKRIYGSCIKVGLDEVLSRFTGLKNLRLSGVQLTCKKALTLSHLEKLSIFGCMNGKIENCEFEGLKNLRVLVFQYNKTITLKPESFKNLTFLEKLDISNNELKEIPDNTFSQLSNLKSLILSNNPLLIIKKETFNGLDNLEHFCFENESNTVFQKMYSKTYKISNM